MPGLIYRELVSSHHGHSVADVRKACLPAKACDDGNFIRGVMGENFPQIDVWECDVETGVVTFLA